MRDSEVVVGKGIKFVDVTDAATLATALSAAVSSQSLVVIRCAAGNYGNVNLGDNRTFASGVVIQSNHDAVFNTIDIVNIRNLTLQNIVVDYQSSTGSTRALFIRGGSRNIKCHEVTVTGTLNSRGIEVNNYSTDIEIVACELYGTLASCIQLVSGVNVRVIGCSLHDYTTDGFQIADVDGLIIRGNSISNSGTYTEAAHADFVQFYTGSAPLYPARNVEISSNKFLQGNNPGAGTQGMLIQDDILGVGGFNNWLIENNLISPDNGSHGITCGNGSDPVFNNTTIRNNTVVRNGTSGTSIWMRSAGASVGNVVQDNVANAYTINTSNVTQTGNVTAANTSYNSLFINGYRGTEPQDWLPVPGSAVDFGSGVGCDVLMQSIARPTYWVETTYAGLQVTCVAKPYRDPDLDETGFTYAWTSSDGGSGTGKTWIRTFASSGTYTVSVTVNGGETFEKTVIVA